MNYVLPRMARFISVLVLGRHDNEGKYCCIQHLLEPFLRREPSRRLKVKFGGLQPEAI